VLDLLGFGGSEKPVGHAYSLREQAAIVAALWEELGVGATALVSHDYGVSVAQELLARDAGRITRAAFLNGGLYPDLHRPIRVQRLLHGPAGAVLGPMSSELLYRRTMGRILGRSVSGDVLHQMWLATSAGGGRWVQHGLLGYIDERHQFSERWVGAMESYGGPMAFIWGPADPISGAHVLERLRKRLPAATFVELGDAPATGHYPQLENPEAVAAALTAFLAS
jgi:pimeloyl-ACP methyl ester carboxylesterase